MHIWVVLKLNKMNTGTAHYLVSNVGSISPVSTFKTIFSKQQQQCETRTVNVRRIPRLSWVGNVHFTTPTNHTQPWYAPNALLNVCSSPRWVEYVIVNM